MMLGYWLMWRHRIHTSFNQKLKGFIHRKKRSKPTALDYIMRFLSAYLCSVGKMDVSLFLFLRFFFSSSGSILLYLLLNWLESNKMERKHDFLGINIADIRISSFLFWAVGFVFEGVTGTICAHSPPSSISQREGVPFFASLYFSPPFCFWYSSLFCGDPEESQSREKPKKMKRETTRNILHRSLFMDVSTHNVSSSSFNNNKNPGKSFYFTSKINPICNNYDWGTIKSSAH